MSIHDDGTHMATGAEMAVQREAAPDVAAFEYLDPAEYPASQLAEMERTERAAERATHHFPLGDIVRTLRNMGVAVTVPSPRNARIRSRREDR